GAQRNETPRLINSARISADPSMEIDELSITSCGCRSPDINPPGANNTSFRSAVVETIVKTTSQEARSWRLATTRTPRAPRFSALLRVRFHTETSWLAPARRLTMASPIRPNPIHPIVFSIIGSSFNDGDRSPVQWNSQQGG